MGARAPAWASLEAWDDAPNDYAVGSPAPSLSVTLLDNTTFSYDDKGAVSSGVLPLIIMAVNAQDPFVQWMLNAPESLDHFLSNAVASVTYLFIGYDDRGRECVKAFAKRLALRARHTLSSERAATARLARVKFARESVADVEGQGGELGAWLRQGAWRSTYYATTFSGLDAADETADDDADAAAADAADDADDGDDATTTACSMFGCAGDGSAAGAGAAATLSQAHDGGAAARDAGGGRGGRRRRARGRDGDDALRAAARLQVRVVRVAERRAVRARRRRQRVRRLQREREAVRARVRARERRGAARTRTPRSSCSTRPRPRARSSSPRPARSCCGRSASTTRRTGGRRPR